MTPTQVKEVPVDQRNKALRAALKQLPAEKVRVVLAGCGLTPEEQKSLLEHLGGADLNWISGKINTSDRTTDRRRASALAKLRKELEK